MNNKSISIFLAAPPEGNKWFPQKPIVYPTVAALLIYSMIAARLPEVLAWVDQFVTPMVDGLRFIGLGITKPLMDGPMPERFYANMVGIGVWGVVAYNVMTILYLIANKRGALVGGPRAAEQRMMENKGWGRVRAWFALRALILFLLFPLAVYITLALLNGVHGWIVFHVKDFIIPPAFTMMWVFPGAFISTLWISLAEYFVYDFLQLFRFFSRKE